ncbi:MAG: hypothetical protein ACQET8_22565 [Bacillota bacterium]
MENYYANTKTEQEVHIGQGTLILDVMTKISADNEDNAIIELITLLNSQNALIEELTVKTVSGNVVKLKVSNYDLEWDCVTPEDEMY